MGCQYYAPVENGADSFSIAIPRITFGRGCLKELGARAARRGLKRVALLTDDHLRDGPLVALAIDSLTRAGIDHAVFSDIRIEPCDVTVKKTADFLNDSRFDGVISVGGGSVIDTAKAAMVEHMFKHPIVDYFAKPYGKARAVPAAVLPHIACPTTSGTGSECTSISVLRLMQYNTKFVIASPYLLPDEALIDPACCDSLPATAVASTGFDLLCHALECYTAKAYTQHARVEDINQRQLIQGSNPWSEIMAREALSLVSQNLERGVRDNTDFEARDKLSWAASLAGAAFGNSGTHLPHAMSYGITHLMRDIETPGYPVASPFVPHGISVVVSAPAIFRYTAVATPERHMEAAGYLHADSNGATPDDAGEVLANRLIELMRATDIPNGLSGVGFGADDVTALAESSVRQGRAIANAPRESNLVDLQNIYSNAISYW